MREILFRGKRADNGEWVYGDAWHNYDDEPRCIKDYCGANPVDPDTVGQYTGLADKNGKKIFEGDIVNFHMFNDEPDWIGFVNYDISMFIVEGDHYTGRSRFETQLCSLDRSRLRVIGNIHDNPELLKGDNDAAR